MAAASMPKKKLAHETRGGGLPGSGGEQCVLEEGKEGSWRLSPYGQGGTSTAGEEEKKDRDSLWEFKVKKNKKDQGNWGGKDNLYYIRFLCRKRNGMIGKETMAGKPAIPSSDREGEKEDMSLKSKWKGPNQVKRL